MSDLVEVVLSPGGSHTTKKGDLHVAGDKFLVTRAEQEAWPNRLLLAETRPVEIKADASKKETSDTKKGK
jgi:hypothetical protein